jgi:hypothetical protein
MMFRIQIGRSVMGKYARASLEFLLLFLFLITSLLNLFFEFPKKNDGTVRGDTGSRTPSTTAMADGQTH